jgi:hypothetical protein
LIWGTWSPIVDVDRTNVTRRRWHVVAANLLVPTSIWQKRCVDIFYQSNEGTIELCLICNMKKMEKLFKW